MPARRISGFLRAEPSRFLGRASELARLDAPLALGKLVTIIGPSGIGKTRLALRYGITRLERYAAVWFCDVSEARDLEEMITMIRRRLSPTIAKAMSAHASAAALERAFAARAGALVIVDNVEHLLPAAAETIRGWLRAAPEVRFVVTSRVRLDIGEESFELGALELPAPGATASDAIDLFVDRVRTHRGTYEPGLDERARIAEIVKSLSGVPLAIELAAARAGDDDDDAPVSDSLPEIHRGAIAWTTTERSAERAIERAFSALSAVEQEALAQASVFHGSFTLAAATQVIHLSGALATETVVTTLARKSLLQVERHDPLRFAMSESIRSFASRRLDRVEGKAVEGRHADLFASRALAITMARTRDPRVPSDAEDDRTDLGAAMAFAAKAGRAAIVLRIAIALDAISNGEGLDRAELALLDQAIQAGAAHDLALVGRALGVRAASLYALGRLDEARCDAEMALRLATELSDRRQIGAMSKVAGEAAFQLGDFTRATAHLERALAIAEERSDDSMTSAVHYLLGSLHQSQGDRQRARIGFGMSLAIAVRARDAAAEARSEMGLAWEHLDLGDHAGALGRYDRAIELALPLGLERTVRIVTGYVGVLHFDAGALAEAEEHLRRGAFESKRAGDVRVEGIFEGIRGAVLAALDRIAESRQSFVLAGELLAANVFYAEVIAVHRGHLDLAEARAASRRGDDEAAKKHVAAARSRIESARSPGPSGESVERRSDDARLGVRILERALGR